ncbi:MAG: hypothetical protein ABI643_01215 [Candidatus Doudnabacteria bacterium]
MSKAFRILFMATLAVLILIALTAGYAELTDMPALKEPIFGFALLCMILVTYFFFDVWQSQPEDVDSQRVFFFGAGCFIVPVLLTLLGSHPTLYYLRGAPIIIWGMICACAVVITAGNSLWYLAVMKVESMVIYLGDKARARRSTKRTSS